MSTQPSGVAVRAKAAFTLIEILTVIAIISILMSILMPVLVKIRDRAREASARNDAIQIAGAISHYVTDYGKMPPLRSPNSGGGSRDNSEGGDTILGSSAANAKFANSALFNTLRAIGEEPNVDHKLNPRRTIYLTMRSVGDPDHPRGGFLDRTGGKNGELKGCLFDPWGTQFNVILDTNFDDVLDVNRIYSDFIDAEKPRVPVAAFSLGKDQKVGTNGDGRFRNGANFSDDILSWR